MRDKRVANILSAFGPLFLIPSLVVWVVWENPFSVSELTTSEIGKWIATLHYMFLFFRLIQVVSPFTMVCCLFALGLSVVCWKPSDLQFRLINVVTIVLGCIFLFIEVKRLILIF